MKGFGDSIPKHSKNLDLYETNLDFLFTLSLLLVVTFYVC